MSFAMRCLLPCLMLLGASAARADAPDLRHSSVFVEGEDFAPVGAGWRAGEGWADDIYEANSGNAVLANDGGSGEAKRDVVIPAAGVYNVWARYLKIGKYAGTFGLRIEQGGTKVFDQQYRTKPEGDDWRAVWEKFEAKLAAGPATVTVYIAQPGIRQRLDCVLLTPDLKYDPNYRDFSPQVFVRFRVLDPLQPTAPRFTTYQHRAPNYYSEPGAITMPGLGVAGDPVPAGAWSPWCEISKYMDADHWLTTVKLRFLTGERPLPHVRADLQLGSEPDEAKAKTFHEDIDGEIVTLVLPGNLAKYPDVPALASEVSARHLAAAKQLGLPPLPPSRDLIPRELWVCGYGDSYRSLKVLSAEMETARLLGANVENDLYGPRRDVAAKLGLRRYFLSEWLPYQAWACPTSATLPKLMDDHFAKIAADITKDDPTALERCYRNILQDEPGTSDLKHLQTCPSCQEAFRKYLAEQKLTPADLGKASWAEVTPLTREQATDAATRRLHCWSIQFRDLTNAQLVREARLAADKHLGSHILECVNFTDGALSGWDAGLINGPDWFLYGRLGSTSLLWSEDWASLGPEVSGYIVDLLRAAARPTKLPVGEYIICNQLPTLEQRAFSALAHGARMLHFYCYGPYYAFADGMVSDNLETQRALGRTLRKIAQADAYLAATQPPRGEAALLYGKSHEIWQEDAAVGTERRTMYLAMQQARVPVDLVSEQDVAEGVLSGYKLLIVTESNFARAAAQKITAWVKAGGVLQMCAGAGMRDETNEPLADLLELAGVRVESVDKPKSDYREHYGIAYAKPTGEIALPADELWSACRLPLLGYRESATPAGAQVLASFSDGKPAVFRNTAAKGTVLRFAFMPGLGYVKSADPGPDRVTVGYKPEPLSVLTSGLKLAGLRPRIGLSELTVEAQLLSGPKEDVLVLVNWSGKDLPAAKVALRGVRCASAESLALGRLQLTREGEITRFSLPLAGTDVIVLKR